MELDRKALKFVLENHFWEGVYDYKVEEIIHAYLAALPQTTIVATPGGGAGGGDLSDIRTVTFPDGKDRTSGGGGGGGDIGRMGTYPPATNAGDTPLIVVMYGAGPPGGMAGPAGTSRPAYTPAPTPPADPVRDELLAALKDVMEWIRAWDPAFRQEGDWSASCERAKSAIAKAEGRK